MDATTPRTPVVLGVDIGGTASRAVLAPLDPLAPAAPRDAPDPQDSLVASAGSPGRSRELVGERVEIGAERTTAVEVAEHLITRALATLDDDEDLVAAAVGATGATSLVDDQDAAVARLAATAGIDPARCALAADVVTAHLGALGGAPGAVVAVGTGSIALGTDFDDVWRRVGGWGHLYDDRGSGAWIGGAGLEAAIQTHDGVRGDGFALLDAAVARYGEPARWPAQLYPHADRAARLAAFAADVAALSADHDPAAMEILRRAGRHVARALAAALAPGMTRAAGTGGVFAIGGVFTAGFAAEFTALAPGVRLQRADGTSLDGAIALARRLADGTAPHHPPFVWIG